MGRVGEPEDPCKNNSLLQHLKSITLPMQETRRGSRQAGAFSSDPYGQWGDSENYVGEWGDDAGHEDDDGTWEEKDEEAASVSEDERSQLSGDSGAVALAPPPRPKQHSSGEDEAAEAAGTSGVEAA